MKDVRWEEGGDFPARNLGGMALVTGATGFVGGKLSPRLLARGIRVRCLVRDAGRLEGKPWASQVEVVTGDIATCETLVQALEGVSTAYYLVHNMSRGKNYIQAESAAAENFAMAAEAAGVGHIIYLGGLAHPQAPIGEHMLSRLKTGEILRRGATPVTEFRASLIIGSGSVSFELIRYMTEQLPALVGPRWARSLCQPVSIENVLDYLLAALDPPPAASRVYEIGGTDRLEYRETMLAYARMRGLRRPFWIMPSIPTELMAYTAHLLTPVDYKLAYPLLKSMNTESTVQDASALNDFPQVHPQSYAQAVHAALENLSPQKVEILLPSDESHVNIKREGFFILASRMRVKATAEEVFATAQGLGGKQGWLYLNCLWRLRGWVDRALGGPGMRGRKEGADLRTGEAVDFYRVDKLEPGRRLRLRAELKAPGEGWMEWEAQPGGDGTSLLLQRMYFAPHGFWGFFYWYILYPFHRLVFFGLARAIARKVEKIRH